MTTGDAEPQILHANWKDFVSVVAVVVMIAALMGLAYWPFLWYAVWPSVAASIGFAVWANDGRSRPDP